MTAEELRAVQAPLKESYRRDPGCARIAARAEARLDPHDIAVHVGGWHGEVVAGLHPAAGGSGALACSGDMLLQALVACAGVTLRAVATAMRVDLRGGRIIAEAHWDARGTLAIDKAAPVGLTDITLSFELETDADPATLDRLLASTERYCVIFQTLRTPPRLSVRMASAVAA